jgi:hypothetical protein
MQAVSNDMENFLYGFLGNFNLSANTMDEFHSVALKCFTISVSTSASTEGLPGPVLCKALPVCLNTSSQSLETVLQLLVLYNLDGVFAFQLRISSPSTTRHTISFLLGLCNVAFSSSLVPLQGEHKLT